LPAPCFSVHEGHAAANMIWELQCIHCLLHTSQLVQLHTYHSAQ